MNPLLSLLALVLVVVLAEKDSDYYIPGFSNPNTANSHYWKDSVNVLQDLDQFESLYITYHHCVWTRYGSRYGSGSNYDEQGQDQDEAENENDNGCGGWGGEHFWYMGRTQCFKANAAYSLYGVLKGDSAPSKLCSKATYINSFFTTFGVESFAGPLGLGVDTANSKCVSSASNNGDANYDDAKADDDYVDDEYEFYNYQDYTSYGTGCSADGDFVIDTYQGAFCHGSNYLSTKDTLDSFNEAIKSFECKQIYSGSNNRDRQLNDGENDDVDFEELDPIYILSYSKSCSLRQYPHDCPDPFGLKKSYSHTMENAMQYKTGNMRDAGIKAMKALSGINVIAGFFSFLFGLVYARRANRALRNKKEHKSSKLERKDSKSTRLRRRRRKLLHIMAKRGTSKSGDEDTDYDGSSVGSTSVRCTSGGSDTCETTTNDAENTRNGVSKKKSPRRSPRKAAEMEQSSSYVPMTEGDVPVKAVTISAGAAKNTKAKSPRRSPRKAAEMKESTSYVPMTEGDVKSAGAAEDTKAKSPRRSHRKATEMEESASYVPMTEEDVPISAGAGEDTKANAPSRSFFFF